MTTLGALRYDLATRLGFTTQGDVSQRQRPILDSFIRTAQYVLYQDLPAHLFYKITTLPVGIGQELYNLPEDFEPNKPHQFLYCGVQGVSTLQSRDLFSLSGASTCDSNAPVPTDTPWQLGLQGGTPRFYSITHQQFLLSPVADASAAKGTLRIHYCTRLPALVNDSDSLLLPYEPVFLLALAEAKAHYQQPDVGQVAQLFERVLKRLRASAVNDDVRYVRRG
jgi:hypothetical protein